MKGIKMGNQKTMKKTLGGDSYGTGIKNPIGKSISNMGVNPVSKIKLKNPPKSLA